MSRIYLLSGWDHLAQVGHTVLFMTAFESGTVSFGDAEEAEILTSGKFESGGLAPLILSVRTRWGEWSDLRPAPLARAKGRFQFGRS